MGGDHAPKTVIAGLELLNNECTSELVLLGDEGALNPLIQKKLKKLPPFKIVHCPENIEMGESPVQAVRTKKNSSIVRGLELIKRNSEAAFFSAGHSGAVFAAALMTLGRIDGVERPAIAAILPSIKGRFILLDAGANVDCRPQHLVDFALMGSTYAKFYSNTETPIVGILSNGEEESKGTDLTREAHEVLKATNDIQYRGYVEGKDIFNGRVDVVVTDGFTGNVVLKSLEGLGETVSKLLKSEIKKSIFAPLGALLLIPVINKLRKKMDYAEVGAAPLLGVDGNCFIGHGRSNPQAIKNGILRAQEAIQRKLHQTLVQEFKQRENKRSEHIQTEHLCEGNKS